MSFRTRLTSFFVLIVVVPMIAVGFLVFRLIGDSEQGKADARASGLATAAASIYAAASNAARFDAEEIARDAAVVARGALRARVSQLASQVGLTRVRLHEGSRIVVDVGDRSAVAPGIASVRPADAPTISVTVSELTTAEYLRELNAPGVAAVVIQGTRTLGSTLARARGARLPVQGTVTLAGTRYRAVTQSFVGFGASPVKVTILSDMSATAAVGVSRLVAASFIAGFLLLAFSFSILGSRALEGQLRRFLQAAQRLGSGDFSSPILIEGHDEFAALGEEFNSMSSQLAGRLDELARERARLRESIRRIGQTFASNLDRPALLDLALRTAVDAVQANWGRLSVRSSAEEPLAETVQVGSAAGLGAHVSAAELAALTHDGLGESASAEVSVASVALGPIEQQGRPHGLITVGRRGRPFTDDDRDVLRSLASQATLALENVELHFQVRHQAVTDELTGIANHGRFQELLSAEMQQVLRYHHPVGLIMLDIDDFKSINDTYGHQQGDVVLEHVARILRESSRDADVPARYGGEEMALILTHTDLDGSYAIAERVRTEIETLRIPRLHPPGTLSITASLGVAASTAGSKDALIAEADAALYAAKRQGKNRTVSSRAATATAFMAE
ncbi:MAG: diguanylate cyclase [Solirubrobacteraceae bacterium]